MFLKNSRLIKRRSVAKELCDRGLVSINGLAVKAARKIKAGDVLALSLSRRKLTFEVIEIPSGNVTKEKAAGLYRIIEELPVAEDF